MGIIHSSISRFGSVLQRKDNGGLMLYYYKKDIPVFRLFSFSVTQFRLLKVSNSS